MMLTNVSLLVSLGSHQRICNIDRFLKELKLAEGRGTGFSIIYSSLEENGSLLPIFETDEGNVCVLCILPIHSLTAYVLGSQHGLSRDKEVLEFKILQALIPILVS